MWRGILFLMGLVGWFSSLFAATAVRDYTLANGLKVVVKEDHRSPVVLSSVWYKVGGSYEHDGLTGISHVLEHMMFRGTTKYPAGVFDRLISSVGGQQNAETTNDYTMFYQLLPADQLPLSFTLEADRMTNLLLTPEDFAHELQVVMEERRMRFDDNPQALAWERFWAAAYVNSPYHHQTIGWMTDLKNMNVRDARRWYQSWYHPNNAVIVVVGDVEAKKVFALAEEKFGHLQRQPLPMRKPQHEVTPLGTIRATVSLPAKLPVLMMGYHTPTLVTAKAAWQPYALDVLANILGGTNSARLQNSLVREKHLLTSVSMDYDPFNLRGNLLQIFATPAPGVRFEEAEAAIIKHINQLKQKPVDLAELDRMKAQMMAAKIYQKDSVQAQAATLGNAEAVGLPWAVGEDYNEAILHITPQQVQAVATMWLVPNALTVLTLPAAEAVAHQPEGLHHDSAAH